MAKKNSIKGFLTSAQKKFLKMSEAKRRTKYGYDVNKRYERIVGHMEQSFWDMQFAYGYLPEKQRNKIDLVQHYQDIVEYIIRKKLTEKVPSISIIDTKKRLQAVIEQYIKEDDSLRKIALPVFGQTLVWLDYLDKNRPFHEGWIPQEDEQDSTPF